MAKKIKIKPVKHKPAKPASKPKKPWPASPVALVFTLALVAGLYFVTPFLYDPPQGIYLASSKNQVSMLKYYLKKYIDPGNAPFAKTSDFAGFDRALLVAVQKNHYEVADLLLNHGADPDANGGECLIEAAARGNKPMVQLLLYWGAEASSNDDAALLMSVIYGHEQVTRYLLDNIYDIADVHANDDLALFWAVSLRRKNMVKLLMQHGADPFSAGDRALHIARFDGDAEMLGLLRI